MFAVQTVKFKTGLAVTGSTAWKAGDESLFQGFSIVRHGVSDNAQSCMILVLVSKKKITQARMVAQD
jgi:hypothetical protein